MAKIICGRCDGDTKCHTCWNEGRIVHPNPTPGQVGSYIVCPECAGRKCCPPCGGSGRVN